MDDESGAGLLHRMLSVVGCFSEDEPALSAADISERTQLAPSTTHRILASLVEAGLVARGPHHRYTIGPRLWELGQLSPLSVRLRETALPHMLRLYEATGENVHLAVLDGPTPPESTVLFVGRVTGRGSIPTLSRVGGRGPLHTTGVGRALLAERDENWLDAYFTVPLLRETTHSITDEQTLRADLERTRARGYALTREEMTLGNVSIASALPPVEGLPPVAISVVVHLDRADERRLGPLVMQTASELARDLQETQ